MPGHGVVQGGGRARTIRNAAKRRLRGLFEVGQHFGVNVLPSHFYSPIPDIATLKRTREWRAPLDMHGVAGTDIAAQVAFLQDLCPDWLTARWRELDVHGVADRENGQGGGYGVIEADVLHAFVRRHRPRRIVQVGCGLATAAILRAAALADYRPEVVCIEPYPSAFVVAAAASDGVTLIAEGAERVPRSVMTALGAGDQRGVDSDELFFAVESTLLHAFLIDNARSRIVLSLSMLHYAAPEAIAAVLPYYRPQPGADGLGMGDGHFPSATYLKTVG